MFLIVLLLAVSSLLALAWWRNQHWKRRGIKSPPSLPLFGNLFDFPGDSRGDAFVLAQWTSIYGSVYGCYKGTTPILIVSEPSAVHDLITAKHSAFTQRILQPSFPHPDDPRTPVGGAQGLRWKRLRALSSPAFTTANLKKILPAVDETMVDIMQQIERDMVGKAHINIFEYTRLFTMNTIRKLALGQGGSDESNKAYMDDCTNALNTPSPWFAWPIWCWQATDPLMRFIKEKSSLFHQPSGLDMLMHSAAIAIHERKERKLKDENATVDDYIEFFLAAETSDGELLDSDGKINKRLTTDEVIGNIAIFLLAGFDTTANTLAMSAFYLAKQQDLQQAVFDEIEEHCNSTSVSYEDLSKLRLTEAVQKEVLRLHPIAAQTASRTATASTTIAGVKIEPGDMVAADIISLHTNHELWGDDALEFRAQRWLEPEVLNVAGRHFYGFGGGPRICLGMRLAVLEQKLALVHLLRKYRIVDTPATGVRLCKLRQKNGLLQSSLDITGNIVLRPTAVNVKLVERE